MSESDSVEIAKFAELAELVEAAYRENGPRTETDSAVIMTTLMLASYCNRRGIEVSYDQAEGMAQHLRDRHLLVSGWIAAEPERQRTLLSALTELGVHVAGLCMVIGGVIIDVVHPFSNPLNAGAAGLCVGVGLGIILGALHVWRRY